MENMVSITPVKHHNVNIITVIMLSSWYQQLLLHRPCKTIYWTMLWAGIWPAVNLIPNPCCSFSAFFPLLSDFSLLLGNSQCIVRVFLLFLIFYFIWLIAVLCRKSRLFKSAYWLNENENLLESEKTSLFCHGIGSRRTMDASNRTWTTVWISPQTCHQSNLSPESGEKKRIQ